MKLKLKIIFFLLLASTPVSAQSLNLRMSTYFYGWQRADSLNGDSKTSHLRGYQNLLLEVSKNKWSFNSLIQVDEDLINKIDKGFGYRFYKCILKN